MDRTIHATNILSWVNLIYDSPYTPWHSAHFLNNGPSAVEVAVNFPDRWTTIEPNKSKDMEGIINIIFYRASPGLNATLEVSGE